MKSKKNSPKLITASDMDKFLLSSSYSGLNRDIAKLKKAYFDYISEEIKKIDVGYPINDVGDLLYELHTKYEEQGIDYDFEELMDKIMNRVKNRLKEFLKDLKEDISKI